MKESTKTKKALRGSLFALFACIVLLIGTTFAWFTDTASTGVNKIQAGNLKVDIVKADDETTSLKGRNMSFVNKDGSADILWEPGVTFKTPAFKIKNAGNLALKYKLTLNGVTGDSELLDVIKFSVVGENGGAIDLDTFEGELKNGELSGALYIQGHMDEAAGNEYQDKSLEGLSLTVVATQLNSENDSFGPDYDKDAPLDFVSVGTTDELKAAFANAKAGENVNVSLTGDVTVSEQTLMIADQKTPDVGDIYIQGNGHTITNTTDNARCVQIANFTSDRKVTISGAKIVSESTATNNSERRGIQIFSVNNATINLNNCDIEMKSNDYSYPIKIGGTSKNLKVNITGCTLTGANCIESFGEGCIVNITNCVLNSNYAPNATYCGNGIQDKNGTNNTYNIKNTTFNGSNAQKWQTSRTTKINDLGGNVDNTTRTTN